MSLPDTLTTHIHLDGGADVLVVTDTREPGESDVNFLARHGRHVLAVIRARDISHPSTVYDKFETLNPQVVTNWNSSLSAEDNTAAHCIAVALAA